MFGSVTRQNICQPLAPRLRAASSSSGPIASSTGISSRATNGKVTNAVASTRLGVAKMTWYLCSRSHGPKYPCAPKRSTNTSPATTGETENGRSIRVTSSVRPGNRNRAMHHAAATPKTRLSATATGATVMVNRMECRVSALPIRFSQYTPGPFSSACAKTLTKGTMIRTPTMTSVASVSPPRTSQWSCRDRRNGDPASGFGSSGRMPLAPPLEDVNHRQEHKRHHQQDDRDGCRLAVGELFESGDDQHRSDLRFVRHVPGDEHDRPVLTNGSGEGQGETGDERRQEIRDDDPAERLPPTRPEDHGRLFRLLVEGLEHRLDGSNDERKPGEHQDQHDPEFRVSPFDAERDQEPAKPPVRDVQRREHHPGHGCRQGERQVHQRVDHPLERELVAHQRPRDDQPEDDVDRGRLQGGGERRRVRGPRPVRPDGGPELREAERRRLQEAGPERDQDQNAQVENRVAQAQREPGQHAAVHRGHGSGPPVAPISMSAHAARSSRQRSSSSSANDPRIPWRSAT